MAAGDGCKYFNGLQAITDYRDCYVDYPTRCFKTEEYGNLIVLEILSVRMSCDHVAYNKQT